MQEDAKGWNIAERDLELEDTEQRLLEEAAEAIHTVATIVLTLTPNP